MQDFINRANAERVAAELFSSARARVYLMAVVALVISAAAAPALAAIWFGAALLAEECHRALSARICALSGRRAGAARLALDFARAAAFAAAPAIAWYGSPEDGQAVGGALLAMLAAHAALNAPPGRRRALAANAPYAFLALVFLAQSGAAGALGPSAAIVIAVGFIFVCTLHHANRGHDARTQDAEWVRQLNMTFADANAAAWEIDFAERRLIGAERLEALIGRSVNFDDVAGAAFAAPRDRALVRAAFSPARGAPRRIAIEHDVPGDSGLSVRVRHQGFVRTTPDGAPVRITCVTRLNEPRAEALPQAAAKGLAAAVAAQGELLRTLSNELSTPPPPPFADGDFSAMLSGFAARATQAVLGVEELARARHTADSANLAKSQFLANMSHELRTPLNAIIGYTEMLQEDAEDAGDATAAQDLNRILTAAKHLLSLLNEILDLSKIEAGRMDVAPAAFEPAALLSEIVETIRPLAEQNGNAITLRCLDGGSAVTDATKLRQCVLNLLSNACKFTRGGQIDIALERRVHNGIAHLYVTVRDTGIGMAPEHLARLFQPFVQADPSITQQYGGTGLGLTITRRLAQLLGGDVSVESTLGAGSTFTLFVPAAFADASAALGAAAKVDAVQGAENAPLVIVIEDEADARELAARALTRAGFAVQGVGGGEAGLALARSKSPALVLLDIFLPDRSGWRVLQSLKQDPKTQDIPVVVLSVNEDRAHAMALGAAEHIVKPADRDMLAATVMRYARKRPNSVDAEAQPTTHKQVG